MKQSRRMIYYKQYMNNPRRKEYERRKKSVLRGVHDPLKPLFLLLAILPIPLAVAIGWVATESATPFNVFKGSIFCIPITIIVGIINLYMIVDAPLLVSDKLKERKIELGKNRLETLKEKFGIAYDLDDCDVFNFECGEISDITDELVCSVTQQCISASEYESFCKQKGNCKYCARMLNAVIAPDASHYMQVKKQ